MLCGVAEADAAKRSPAPTAHVVSGGKSVRTLPRASAVAPRVTVAPGGAVILRLSAPAGRVQAQVDSRSGRLVRRLTALKALDRQRRRFRVVMPRPLPAAGDRLRIVVRFRNKRRGTFFANLSFAGQLGAPAPEVRPRTGGRAPVGAPTTGGARDPGGDPGLDGTSSFLDGGADAPIVSPGATGPREVTRANGTIFDPLTHVMPFGMNGWGRSSFRPEGAVDTLDLTLTDLGRMRTDSVEYLRFPLLPGAHGTNGDPAEPQPWFAFYDELIATAARKGVALLPWLEGGLDNTGPGNPPKTARQLNGFRDAARLAAKRWGPGGDFWRAHGCPGAACSLPYLPIRAWQIWNEPNRTQMWPRYMDFYRAPGAPYDPTREDREYVETVNAYREAVIRAQEGLRASDPQARIVLAGLATHRLDPDGKDPMRRDEFVRLLLQGPNGNCVFDAAAIHFYDSAGTPEQMVARAGDFRQALNAGGAADAQLWITEMGAADAYPDRGAGDRRSQETQRDFVTKTIDLLARRRAELGLGPLMYFSWKDDGSGRPLGQRNPEHVQNTGLYTSGGVSGGTRKLAADALAIPARAAPVLPLPPVRSCP